MVYVFQLGVLLELHGEFICMQGPLHSGKLTRHRGYLCVCCRTRVYGQAKQMIITHLEGKYCCKNCVLGSCDITGEENLFSCTVDVLIQGHWTFLLCIVGSFRTQSINWDIHFLEIVENIMSKIMLIEFV